MPFPAEPRHIDRHRCAPGHSAAIISGVGDDDFGRCILDRLRADGVDVELVQVFPNHSTGVAFVMYEPDGSRNFIFHWDGTPAVMAGAPEAASVGDAPRFFHVMGCSLMANEGFRRRVFQAMELFAARARESASIPISASSSLPDATWKRSRDLSSAGAPFFFPGRRKCRA